MGFGTDKIIESIKKIARSTYSNDKNGNRGKSAEKLAKLLPLLLVGASFTLPILFASLALAFYLTEIHGKLCLWIWIVANLSIADHSFYLLQDNKGLKKALSIPSTHQLKRLILIL